MRLVGEIEHPVMKISIFKMGERFSVKFEHKGVEVTYKFSNEEGANDLARLKEMMDEDFIKKVGKQIHEMIPIRLEKIREYLPEPLENEFDEII
ncbi:MAG: hypothetical protein R2879_17255 [Saprospiraceae bacterium]